MALNGAEWRGRAGTGAERKGLLGEEEELKIIHPRGSRIFFINSSKNRWSYMIVFVMAFPFIKIFPGKKEKKDDLERP